MQGLSAAIEQQVLWWLMPKQPHPACPSLSSGTESVSYDWLTLMAVGIREADPHQSVAPSHNQAGPAALLGCPAAI